MNTPEPHRIRTGRVRRVAPLVGLAGRTAGEAVVESLRRRRSGGDSAEFHARTAERYAEHLGRSKGVLMKAGQILSFTALGPTVSDEQQTVYQRALARLQDSAPPMPFDTAREAVEGELGGPLADWFEEFDPLPIGAASIGQVHSARLRDGRRVAVKLQYPGVGDAIRADLANVELLATFFQIMKSVAPILARLDVRAMAAEVSTRIGEELDYLTEATNQKEFAELYRGHPFIRIPDVVEELTTRRLLVMDLVEGERFSEAVRSSGALRDTWGEAIVRFAIGAMRQGGVFNADPHPGNYIFHDDGAVTFLDFGCVKRFSRENLTHIQALANAAVDGLVAETVRVLKEMGLSDATGKLSDRDLYDWFRCGLELFTKPQPYAATSEHAALAIREKYSVVGPHGDVMRALTVDAHWTMISRVDLGLASILGALESTGPWEAIRSEWDRGGPPATPMGELEAKFWGHKHEFV